ncbi:Zinc finger CCCH domain-containing protein 26 [Cytospora mali]|uniref:Zinc finger CCCH domain-containing protein 26 n=1 Tax=Cytospora mali TaxID=578113 RepID=A0A194VEK1_CYTMA|nr:Zinc finger CCCH domain-containing protein 26 [Valsa mali var. pyri (nom. inval.)]
MHPGPAHFIVRPGTKGGKPGPIVPLIAVDQLPNWMQLVDIPRELEIEQTTGLTNLGIIDKDDDSIYEVRLHHDKIRAILNETEKMTSSSSSGKGSKAKNSSNNSTYPSQGEASAKFKCSKKDSPVAVDLLSLPGQIMAARKQTSQNEDESEPDITTTPSCASIHKEPPANGQQHKLPHPAEPMLNASRHNVVDPVTTTAVRGSKPIRPHMTQPMDDKSHPTAVQRSSITKEKHQAIDSHGKPDTVFCRHWCHHGRCKWGWDCKYQHRMPTTFEGLREIGLKDFPTWYLLAMGSSSGGGFSSMAANAGFGLNNPFGGLAMGNPPGGTTMIPPPQYLNTIPTTHPPSPMDIHLMQDRMSALLGGSDAMSNRQKLRQVKEMEMRDIFMHGSHTHGIAHPQTHPYIHHTYANLHTNASVSAAVVEFSGNYDADEIRPEDSVSGAGRDSVEARVEVERHSLMIDSENGDEDGLISEERLVDI